MGDTTEAHGEPLATAAARLAPCSERLERLRSVWLGLAARCMNVPTFPLGGGRGEL